MLHIPIKHLQRNAYLGIAAVTVVAMTTVWVLGSGFAAAQNDVFTAQLTPSPAATSTPTPTPSPTPTPDTIAPVISGVSSTAVTATSARITWQTNEAAFGAVWYGSSSSSLPSSTSHAAMATTHDVGLENLTASTAYYYKVVSMDAAGNTATSTQYGFVTFASSATTTPTITPSPTPTATPTSTPYVTATPSPSPTSTPSSTPSPEATPIPIASSGNATFTFNAARTTAEFEVHVFDVLKVTEAHLHCAAEGQNGPVIAYLFGLIPGGFDSDGLLAAFTLSKENILAAGTTCPDPVTTIASLYAAMQEGTIYVNVHTAAYPAGEIRGTLHLESTTPSTTVTPSPTATTTPAVTPSPTSTPTSTPYVTATPSPSPTTTPAATTTPSVSPSPSPTSIPSTTPSPTPTPAPPLASTVTPPLLAIVTHLCGEDVHSIDDFASLGGPAQQLLECPVTVLPANSFLPGTLHAEKTSFAYVLRTRDNEQERRTIPASAMKFVPAKVCEPALLYDINGDGVRTADACLDASYYVFDDLPLGDLTSTETVYPSDWRFGTVTFTSTTMGGGNDAASLISFGDGLVNLTNRQDADGRITVHIFHFRT